MNGGGSGENEQEGFAQPTGEGASRSDENAGVQFQPPAEGLAEQAAFTAAPESMAGIPTQLLDARNTLEEAIHQQGPDSWRTVDRGFHIRCGQHSRSRHRTE